LLSQENVADEGLDSLVDAPQIGADDGTRDDDDNRSLYDLGSAGPVDFLQLCPALGDEAATSLASGRNELGLGFGCREALGFKARAVDGHLVTVDRSAIGSRRTAGLGRTSSCGPTSVAPLPSRLSGHYLVSRCGVCFPHQRQNLLNSTLSGEFRFDFCDW
jgi:hypothetical protein